MDEILNPTWSSDGQRIAFSGLVGGLNDLFVYDLGANALKRLTNDAFAELDPAWSPDGRSLAFATDRFTTNLERLESGDLRIAIMDVASGEVRSAAGFPDAKNIGPQWTRDGRGLYFLSDRQGITNVYRVSLEGGEPAQLTNLVTGVSGITALSPAMSAAGGRVIFSVYEEDGYNVYALETEAQMTGTAPVQLPLDAGILPPRTTAEGLVATALQNVTTSLPPADQPRRRRRRTVRSCRSISPGSRPSASGADPFGVYAAGGVSFLFSDILGNHVLATSAQVTSRFDEFGGGVMYLNRTHRWNWGVAVNQTPYVSRGYATATDGVVYQEDEYRFLQIERSASRDPLLSVRSCPPRRGERRIPSDQPQRRPHDPGCTHCRRGNCSTNRSRSCPPSRH